MPVGAASILTCVMAMMDPHELRQRADFFRSLALSGHDMHLKFSLLEVADEFDSEAAASEADLIDVEARAG
jgi:hypothetical protein